MIYKKRQVQNSALVTSIWKVFKINETESREWKCPYLYVRWIVDLANRLYMTSDVPMQVKPVMTLYGLNSASRNLRWNHLYNNCSIPLFYGAINLPCSAHNIFINLHIKCSLFCNLLIFSRAFTTSLVNIICTIILPQNGNIFTPIAMSANMVSTHVAL